MKPARHAAILVHHLADDARRLEAGEAGEVDGALGLAGAPQHAAAARAQREHVPRPLQVVGSGAAVDQRLDGGRAVVGGDAGGDAGGGLDRHRERRAVLGAVAAGHRRQAKALAALARQRQADQAAAMLGHEVDRLGRHVVGGQHQVAFVFAVFLVDEDHHAASGQLGDQFGNGGNRHAGIVGGGPRATRSPGLAQNAARPGGRRRSRRSAPMRSTSTNSKSRLSASEASGPMAAMPRPGPSRRGAT